MSGMRQARSLRTSSVNANGSWIAAVGFIETDPVPLPMALGNARVHEGTGHRKLSGERFDGENG
jgi:hypothetical protein